MQLCGRGCVFGSDLGRDPWARSTRIAQGQDAEKHPSRLRRWSNVNEGVEQRGECPFSQKRYPLYSQQVCEFRLPRVFGLTVTVGMTGDTDAMQQFNAGMLQALHADA